MRAWAFSIYLWISSSCTFLYNFRYSCSCAHGSSLCSWRLCLTRNEPTPTSLSRHDSCLLSTTSAIYPQCFYQRLMNPTITFDPGVPKCMLKSPSFPIEPRLESHMALVSNTILLGSCFGSNTHDLGLKNQ